MRQHGPIILIDDDLDDQEIVQEVLRGLNIQNQLLFLKTAKKLKLIYAQLHIIRF